MESIYVSKSYRDFVKMKIETAEDRWGVISRMADAAGCQRSQLSRVLSSHIHLTLDQAYGLCEFWKLNEEESSFFLKLVEYERAGQKRYREKLSRDLDRERRRQNDLATRLKHPPVGHDQLQSFYYSAWHWTAIHVLVSIPDFRTVARISERLSLPPSVVEMCLNFLKQWNLVERKNNQWIYSSQTSHLSRQSPLISSHHSNWRQRAVINSQVPGDDSLHFTIVQSMTEEDFQKIKSVLLQTIDKYNSMAGPSEPRELFCFNCDFFRV